MQLTIATPVYDDLYGTQMTMQDLVMHHRLTPDVELLVIDNHPTTQILDGKTIPSKATAKLHSYCKNMGIRYIPMPAPIGTAPPRNRAMAEAAGDVVIVCDCHVLFADGALWAIQDYFADPAHARDIVSGPMLTKSRQPNGRLGVLATHYADRWRKDMWGTWAQAWSCECRRWHFDVTESTPPASVIQFDAGGAIIAAPPQPRATICEYHTITLGRQLVTACPECGRPLPDLPYKKHAQQLEAAGYVRRCWSSADSEPFEIGGMGLGMFACLKQHWPGFPPEMTGFGGGEMHLHETFRRAGGRAVCLPAAGWWHQFERSGDKVPYTVGTWQIVRNYVLWRKRLAMPLEPVHDHFILERKQITQAQWKYLLADPIAHEQWPGNQPGNQPAAPKPTPPKGRPQPPDSADSIATIYEWVLTTDRDPVPHLPTLRALAAQCQTVVSLCKRREWDVAVMATQSGPPGPGGSSLRYIAHNLETDPLQDRLQAIAPYQLDHLDSLAADPIACDLLLIDTQHTAERLQLELTRWVPHVRRWIVLRGTATFGERGESKAKEKPPGLLHAVRELLAADPRWKRVYQNDERYGLTVLSCDPRERTIDRAVGFHTHRIFESINVHMQKDCACRRRIRDMDAWGPDGCRERLDEIVTALNADRAKYSWGTQLNAAVKVGLKVFGDGDDRQLALAILKHSTDPIRGIILEAIRRTEADDAAWAATFAPELAPGVA